MSIIKVVFEVLFKPRDFFKGVIKKRFRVPFLIKYMLLLNLIGPSLSFYSMHFVEHISAGRSLLYALLTYILDIVCIFVFAYLVSFLEKKDFYLFLEISIFVYTPIWLSDIVDIYQYLRPLSNLGLLYSLFLVYRAFSALNIKKEKIFLHIGVFLLLYVLDAFIAETIVQNPWVEMIIR